MNPKKKSVEQELEQLSPLLLRLKQQDGQDTVPEGYFEELPENILKLVNNRPEASSHSIARVRPLWVRFAAAASVVLILGAAFFFLQNDAVRSTSEVAIDLSSQEVESYIQANLEEFELDLLVEYAAKTAPSSFNNLFEEEFENGDLDQYMDELIDAVDLETIEELL
jgi:hypothetical protein